MRRVWCGNGLCEVTQTICIIWTYTSREMREVNMNSNLTWWFCRFLHRIVCVLFFARMQGSNNKRVSGPGKARRKGHTFYTRGSCFVVFASLLTHIIVFCTTVLSIDIVARLLNAHSLLSVSFSLCAYVCKMFILHRVQSVAWVAKAILFLLLRFYLRFQLAVFIHCSHTQFFLSNFFLLALIFMCMCEIL